MTRPYFAGSSGKKILLMFLSSLMCAFTMSAQQSPTAVGAGGGVGGASTTGIMGKLVALDAKAQTLSLRQHKSSGSFNPTGASPLISRMDEDKDWMLSTFRISPQTRFVMWPNQPATREQTEKLLGKRVTVRVGTGKSSSPSLLAVSLWSEFSGVRGTLVAVDAAARLITVNCPPLVEDFDPRDTKSAADVTAQLSADCAFLAYDTGAKISPGKSVSAKPSSLAALKSGSKIQVNFIRIGDGSLQARMLVLNPP